MDITRHRFLRVRMGDYESFEFSATVRLSHTDLGYPADHVFSPEEASTANAALRGFANAALDELLQDDIEDAAALTGDRKSFIHKIA